MFLSGVRLPVFPRFFYNELRFFFLIKNKCKIYCLSKEVAIVFKENQKIKENQPLQLLGPGPSRPGWTGVCGHSSPGELLTLRSSPQLGEQLKRLVPAGGLTVMDLEVEGVCVRFSPLATAAGN